MEDFTGTTISLTNPGTIGTNHSVPRLTAGQGAILGVGAMEYPAEFQGMNPDALTEMAVSKIITLTSTYDHRIIQGAESGDFLRRLHALLLGEDGFYDKVFRSLRIPYEPVRWMPDVRITREGQIDKEARVIEVIESYRRNGHLMADTDPLEFKVRTHPDLDILEHGLTLWDLDRKFPVGGFAGERLMALRDILGVLRNSYCRTVGVEYMHITDPEEREWLQQRIEVKHEQPDREKQKHVLGRLNAAEAFETFLQTKYVGPEAVQPRGRRVGHPDPRRGADRRHRPRPRRGRDRHGPPRPAQRPGQRAGQELRQDLRRVRGQHRPGHRAGLRRREVPPRRHRHVPQPVHAPTPRSPSRWPATRATWRRSTRSSRASSAPSRT